MAFLGVFWFCFKTFIWKKVHKQNRDSYNWVFDELNEIKGLFFNGVLFLIYYIKKQVKPCFFILMALQDILQHFKFVNWWIREFVVSFFDVTTRLQITFLGCSWSWSKVLEKNREFSGDLNPCWHCSSIMNNGKSNIAQWVLNLLEVPFSI